MPTTSKTPARKPAAKPTATDKNPQKPAVPAAGDTIVYAREDSGRLIPDHDLVLVPGEHLEVGLDVSLPLAKRLVETGNCRIASAKKAEPAKKADAKPAKEEKSKPAPTPTEVVQAEQQAVAQAETDASNSVVEHSASPV